MIQKLCRFLFRTLGWTSDDELCGFDKCIVIGVPHTSAWDFIIAWIYYTSLGGKINFLIKKEFFFWPIGYFIRKMGGLPIDRSKGANVIRQTIKLFEENEQLQLAITPEGTRKRTTKWKAGFHIIARSAEVPVVLGSFDWGRKKITIWGTFELSEDAKKDIRKIKDFYQEKGIQGKFPENFTTD